jgi:isoquinoline 1-oxidoreductase beta subunit
MEPAAAIVSVHGSKAEIWAGTQVPVVVRNDVAKQLGIAPENVTLHAQLMGGSFGRKLETDVILQATAIAAQCPFPVKTVWSREEDMQRDNFRPMYLDRIKAGLGPDGLPVVWHHRITSASVFERFAPDALRSNGVDPDVVDGAEEPVYGRFAHMRVEFVNRRPPPGLILSWWRGVGALHNMFVIESFIDDLARTVHRDPIQYRRQLLAKVPRVLAVLDRVAHESNWGTPLPKRSGRGVMVQSWLGTYIGLVVEVAVSDDGEVALKRITVAIDCGVAVNPDLVKQQMEGGVLFGLSAALFSEITFDRGEVQQSNFHNYRALRISESPPIAVHILPSNEPPGGVGETGCSAAAPALRNAILDATGVGLRELPIRRELLKKKT